MMVKLLEWKKISSAIKGLLVGLLFLFGLRILQYAISLGHSVSTIADHPNQDSPKPDPSFSGNIHPKCTSGDWYTSRLFAGQKAV